MKENKIIENTNNFLAIQTTDNENKLSILFYSYKAYIGSLSEDGLYISSKYWNYSQTTQKHYKKVLSKYYYMTESDYNHIKKLIKEDNTKELERKYKILLGW